MSHKIEITLDKGTYDKLANKAGKGSIEKYVRKLVMSHAMTTTTAVKAKKVVRYSTGILELDKVLGGGFILGSTILLGAPRGSGKSSMLLQACDGFAQDGRKAFFASAEMTQDRLLAYAKRLGIKNVNIGLSCDPMGINVEDLFEDVLRNGRRGTKATLLVIDSLQTSFVSDVKGDIGNPAQMNAVINMVSSFAQKEQVAVVVIGHIGKAGDYLGSAKMKFLVDCLLRMDIKWVFNKGKLPMDSMVREISTEKNRQGRSDITSLVELTDTGIKTPSVKAMRMLDTVKK